MNVSASPTVRIAALLIRCACAALLISCGAPVRKPSVPERPTAEAKTRPKAVKKPPRWETRTFERSFGLCAEPPSDCARVTLTYPVSTGDAKTPAVEAVQWFVEKYLLAPVVSEIRPPDMETLAAEFVNEYEQVKRDLKEYRSYWYMHRTVSVLHVDARVVSLRFSEDIYTGGAHPNAFRRYQSFDAESGSPLSIADLVLPGAGGKLETVAAEIFREMYDIAPGVSMTEAGFWFENGRFRLNDNFALTAEGLIFYYNLYEIASYARGPTELRIPFSALQGVLQLRWTN
jgi:hypothetical protein